MLPGAGRTPGREVLSSDRRRSAEAGHRGGFINIYRRESGRGAEPGTPRPFISLLIKHEVGCTLLDAFVPQPPITDAPRCSAGNINERCTPPRPRRLYFLRFQRGTC